MNTAGIWKQMQEASEASAGKVKLELMKPDDEISRKDWKLLIVGEDE
jgi:hypothetical protein